jgi:glutamate 5-kinase
MKRVVIKVGSAVLTQDGTLALERLYNLVEFISELKNQKKYEVILVSSGAVAAGYTLCQLDKTSLGNTQALASLGQPLLMETYRKKFARYDILCAQVLLEASDLRHEETLHNTKVTMTQLLKNNIVPIINENDVTAVDELVFGDNDQLSAHVAYHFDADLLVILTDIDGYYDSNPKTNAHAKLIKQVDSLSDEELNQSDSANDSFATGGIVTKLKAGDYLLDKDIPMYLSSGFDLKFAKEYLINNNHLGGTVFKK